MAFGLSGAKAESQSTSTQDVFQSDVFAKLFSDVGNIAGGIDTTGLTQTANDLLFQGSGFLESLQGAAAGTDVSGEFLSGRISGEGGFVDENISALSEDLSKFFNEELLPGITSQAVGGGQLGGGRQGVAQGKAIESVGREFRRGSLDIRNQDLRERSEAARQLSAQKLTAAQAGLTGVQSQFDLANAATLAPFSPFLTLAKILGGPTVLTQQQSTSSSFSAGVSAGP